MIDSAHCWWHIWEVAEAIFGVGIPAKNNKWSLKGNSNWKTLFSQQNLSASEAWNAIKTTKPGDVIQFSSSRTATHTMIVYSNDGTTVKFYNSVRPDTTATTQFSRFRSVTSSNITANMGSFNSDSSYGLSLYKYVKNPEYDEDPYISQCTHYGSYGTIHVSEASTAKSLPCSKSTNSLSEDIETATGKTYLQTGIFRNTAGNYWYRVVTSDGKTAYVYSGDVDQCTTRNDDISISSDKTIPVNHTQGECISDEGNCFYAVFSTGFSVCLYKVWKYYYL